MWLADARDDLGANQDEHPWRELHLRWGRTRGADHAVVPAYAGIVKGLIGKQRICGCDCVAGDTSRFPHEQMKSRLRLWTEGIRLCAMIPAIERRVG